MDLVEDDEAHKLDFPIVYAAAKAGRASLEQPADGTMPDSENLEPLFDLILEAIPAPTYTDGAPLQAHVTNLDSSPYLGRLALCRIVEGRSARPAGGLDPPRRQPQQHRQAVRAADDQRARAGAGRVGRPGRHRRDRGHPRHHDRRDLADPADPLPCR